MKLRQVVTNQVATFSLYKVVKIKSKKEMSVKVLLAAIPIVIVTALSALLLVEKKTKLREVKVR